MIEILYAFDSVEIPIEAWCLKIDLDFDRNNTGRLKKKLFILKRSIQTYLTILPFKSLKALKDNFNYKITNDCEYKDMKNIKHDVQITQFLRGKIYLSINYLTKLEIFKLKENLQVNL
jgi:hypothetical protein